MIYIYIYIVLHVKHPLFTSVVNDKFNYLGRFSKNTQISNFMKIGLVGAKFFHADRQTDIQTRRS